MLHLEFYLVEFLCFERGTFDAVDDLFSDYCALYLVTAKLFGQVDLWRLFLVVVAAYAHVEKLSNTDTKETQRLTLYRSSGARARVLMHNNEIR
jgi:hypothetical protein